jgi:glycosyltransferase involved in cell wall biosynthesis
VSDQLRVLYSFPHPLGSPGIGTSAWHQVQEVVRRGARVTVIASSFERPVTGAQRSVASLAVAGTRIPHRAVGLRRAYRYHDRRVARHVLRHAEEIDVIHLWPPACLETAKAARAMRVPVLREAPSAHTATAFEEARREQEVTGVVLPEGHAFRFDAAKLAREEAEFAVVDALLVPSEAAADTYRARGIPEERIETHRYGFDPAAFTPAQRDTRAGLQAVFVGRGEPTKGLHYMLDAWIESRAASNGRLAIVGAMLPEYEDYLAPRLAHPSVERLPFTRSVAAIMQQADVLLLSSVTEGSALVTYEAIGSGCVPLVSAAAGAPCAHEVDCLVHPTRDVARLTEHIDSVATDPSRLEGLRKGALARRDELTWSAAGGLLLEIYARRAATPEVPE